MKFLALLLSLISFSAFADTKITDLPLGLAATSNVNSVVPYVDTGSNITKKMKLSDFINIPALADPTFCTGKAITGFSAGAGTVADTDTILQAINKIVGNIAAISSASVAVGTFDSQTPSANGQTIALNFLYGQSADATHPGMVNTGSQTFAGQKTFSTGVTASVTGHSSLDLSIANNLSDLANAGTARTNLGLGSIATFASSAYLAVANNLSDIANAATARTNLGLGTAATFASSAFLQAANNLSDLASAATARTNLGLGTIATQSATSGSAIQKGNGTGGLTAISASDVTGQLLTGYVSGAGVVASTDSILAAIQKLNGNIGALGTPVTAVSVASANGLAGTSSGGTTPALTLSTSVNGMVKGNGTAFSAATSGTDYQAPISTSGAVANQFVTGFTAPNTFTRAQPAFTDISGSIATSQIPNTAVTPGSYTTANITVDAQGRITAAANGSASGGSGASNAFTIEGAVVPYTTIGGAFYITASQTLSTVNIAALNSGSSGSTTVQVNQWRSGSLFNSATASLASASGAPSGTTATLSGALSLASGDTITVDVNSIAAGASDLSVVIATATAVSNSATLNIATYTTDTTATNSNDVIRMNCSSACTLTMQANSTATIKPYRIKQIGTAQATIAFNGANSTDSGQTTIILPAGGVPAAAVELVPTGSGTWDIF